MHVETGERCRVKNEGLHRKRTHVNRLRSDALVQQRPHRADRAKRVAVHDDFLHAPRVLLGEVRAQVVQPLDRDVVVQRERVTHLRVVPYERTSGWS